MAKPKRPGVYCVQIGLQNEDRLDFHARDATSLEDALGHAREAVTTHPDLDWDCIIIWNGHDAAEVMEMAEKGE